MKLPLQLWWLARLGGGRPAAVQTTTAALETKIAASEDFGIPS